MKKLILILCLFGGKVFSQTIRTNFQKGVEIYWDVTWVSQPRTTLKQAVLDPKFPGAKTSQSEYLQSSADFLNLQNVPEIAGFDQQFTENDLLGFWKEAKLKKVEASGYNTIPRQNGGDLDGWKDSYTGIGWVYEAPNGAEIILAKNACGNAFLAVIEPPKQVVKITITEVVEEIIIVSSPPINPPPSISLNFPPIMNLEQQDNTNYAMLAAMPYLQRQPWQPVIILGGQSNGYQNCNYSYSQSQPKKNYVQGTILPRNFPGPGGDTGGGTGPGPGGDTGGGTGGGGTGSDTGPGPGGG